MQRPGSDVEVSAGGDVRDAHGRALFVFETPQKSLWTKGSMFWRPTFSSFTARSYQKSLKKGSYCSVECSTVIEEASPARMAGHHRAVKFATYIWIMRRLLPRHEDYLGMDEAAMMIRTVTKKDIHTTMEIHYNESHRELTPRGGGERGLPAKAASLALQGSSSPRGPGTDWMGV
jgi:hypothetical protein